MDQIGEKKPAYGTMMLLISGLCWSSVAILAKIGINAGLNSMTINSARLFIGGGVIFLYLFFFRRVAFRASGKNIFSLLILGIFDYAIGGILFLGSLHFIDASLAFLMLYTYPAMVVIISAIAGREPFSRKNFLAVLITVIGVGMVLEAGTIIEGREWIGVAMVLSAAFIFSLYMVIVDAMMEEVRSSTVIFYSFLGGAIGTVFLLPFLPLEIEAALLPGNMAILLVASILGSVLSLMFFLIGLRHVGPTKTAVITTVEPIFVVAIAGIFLSEFLSAWQWLGVLVQLTGVFIVHQEPQNIEDPVPK